MAQLLPKYLEPSCYAVVLGGAAETQLLLDEKFNHIFYTGNSGVAREIAAKAGKHLTTTTFELGGKRRLNDY
jgi:aldehyde dehydrogenase (NAD+)